MRMDRKKGFLPLLAAAVTAWAAACGPSRASEGSEGGDGSDAASEFVRTVNVEVQAVKPSQFVRRVRITGAVEALHDVTVSAQESGVILRFLAEKGETVRAGQALARIDDKVLRARVEEARAVERLARERHERQRRLWEEERIGSEMAFLQTKYDAASAAARLANLEARLARTRITTPISGIFDQRFVDAGEMVSPGTPVARVIQTARLKIVGGVPERFAAHVEVGGEAEVTFDIFPGRTFTGRIGFVGSSVDEQSRTFPIEILLENPGRLVKPQMVANVEVPVQRLAGVIVVPQEVLQRTEEGYQLLVVGEADGVHTAEARDVLVGPSSGNRTVIEEGLEPGDRLIVRGFQLVAPGDRVRIVKRAAAGTAPR
ncbi:MAG: efflux RND transporter periplasmic adaptor subunit [Gemmatimonadota bacterium]